MTDTTHLSTCSAVALVGGGGNSIDARVASMAFWIAEDGLELC